MTTIPARLAKVSQVSTSLAHAQSRSRALYRNLYRAAPEICEMYPLDVSPALLRAKFRAMFDRNSHIKDVAVIDLLLLKGYQEYQETMNAWKQTPHIMKWFAEEDAPAKPTTFLEKFYATRDEGRGPTHEGL
ncbi:ndufa6 NADH-ubiquinone oxidoreductase subunit [Malassezia cuniculi]|uniref:Ndufa6 NADH-ubiquinone oxidoreductase subunit n=1 Tax=Malassezia cuniculi TaxID=948313 RepID=A0AAF0ERW0_9BASI|nr:ndufa6 NADH-ubiquinone oxidoreductase subunit [Malassezia cuniculi]